MKDQLIAVVSQKTGLDAAMAEKAADAVLGFLQEHPDQLEGMLGLDPEKAQGLMSKLTGMFKR